MRFRPVVLLVLPLAAGCLQSRHGNGPNHSPPPGGVVRVLGEEPGRGRAVAYGDRIRVDLIGRYGSGEVWAQGPLTLIVGRGSYPGVGDLRVGSVIRMQVLTSPNDTASRLLRFEGGDPENEVYQVRRDRGPIVVEHTVRKACRPMKVFFLQTGFGPIEMDLGCWPVVRRGGPRPDPRIAALERAMSGLASAGADSEDPGLFDPPASPRERADTSRFLGDDALHLAAREGRPEVAAWLLERGYDVAAVDSFGFQPIHYVGWAQMPFERFTPALEQSYLDVLDTLVSHGAQVDARAGPGRPRGLTLPANEHQGRTALDFAAPSCADRLVRRLLEQGARPNAGNGRGSASLGDAAGNGCPETVHLLLAAGAEVDGDPGGGTPLERLAAVSAFHRGHFESARLLVEAGARTAVAEQRLHARLKDRKPGGFGFNNRPEARRILARLRRRR